MLQFFLLALLAPSDCSAAGPTPMVAGNCKDFDLRKEAPGFTCRTSKAAVFSLAQRSERGGEIWKDHASGLLWGDKLPERIRRRAAAELCRKFSGTQEGPGKKLSSLPSLKQFEEAETRGFREVLPNIKDHFYWADSTVPGAKNIGHVFNGNLGKPELVVYRSINFENVRCIGR